MKKIAALLSLLLLVIPLGGCSGNKTLEDGVLTIGLECDYAPFNWTSTSKVDGSVVISNSGFLGIGKTYCAGYDIKIASKVAEELGYTLQVRKMSWKGLIPALNASNIDAIIAGMTDTPLRRESVSFTSPYYESELVMVVNASSIYATATSIYDFENATLTAQMGTVQSDLIAEIAGADAEDELYVPGLKSATPYETYPNALNMILERNSNIDGVLAERPVGEAMIDAHPESLVMINLGEIDENFIITVSIALRKADTDLRDAINAVLASISNETRTSWMEAAIAADKG